MIVAGLVVLSSIKQANEWERIPILRLGRYVGMRGPGLFWKWPIIEQIPFRIDLRIKVREIRTEERTLTKDNVPVNVGSILYVQPVKQHLEKLILNIDDYENATILATQTTLRETIGKHTLQELLSDREKVAEELQKIIDEKTEAWGVKVHSVEIREVEIPSQLQDAIARVAEAERERQSRVTLAQAEVEAAGKMLEAASNYDKSPRAMELRWMNQIHDIGLHGVGTVILVPTDMPMAGVGGVLGLEKLRPKRKRE
ncbi:slipin family protein [Candidatus Woesearchaeota archaeon]|nr:slipin family protein [Candidatus Woesearchaeota archaeon]